MQLLSAENGAGAEYNSGGQRKAPG
jgi:hypothetical protein